MKKNKQFTEGPNLRYPHTWVLYDPKTFNPVIDIYDKCRHFMFDRVVPGNWDMFVITGVFGLQRIHEGIEDKYPMTAEDSPINTEKSYSGNITYNFGLGSMTVVHNPQLDSVLISGVSYPGTHYPLSSGTYRVFIHGDLIATFRPDFITNNEEE